MNIIFTTFRPHQIHLGCFGSTDFVLIFYSINVDQDFHAPVEVTKLSAGCVLGQPRLFRTGNHKIIIKRPRESYG